MIDYEALRAFYKNKKVLITGHTGFKGSYMTAVLGMLGAEVYGYALKPESSPCLFEIMYGSGMASRDETELGLRLPEGYYPGRICLQESHIADIRDLEELKSYYDRVRPDVVFHLAAQPIVRESYRIPRDTFEINVMGTVNLLECIRDNPCCCSFVNVTTDKVYKNDERPDYAFREDDPLDGRDPYSNSKSCSDIITHSYAASFLNASGVAVSTARAGNVIGGGDFAADRILPDCVRAAVNSVPVSVRNPYSIRPYQHVFEAVFIYLVIAMRQAEDAGFAGSYNVGPDMDDCVTTGRLCELFCGSYGRGASWENASSGQGPFEAGFLRLDNSKLKETFGWQPVWHIAESVDATVRWTKAWLKGQEEANAELVRQAAAYMDN